MKSSLLFSFLLTVAVGEINGHSKKVAFQVEQVKHPLAPSNKEVLRFDHTQLNIGNAYNPNTGIFTAPVTGIYQFWANIISYQRGWYGIKLQKGGKELTRGYPGHLVDKGVATITHVAKLKKGDHVWFEYHEYGESRSKLYGQRYSSYGGTFLFR